jgi:C1A family cysteine protease
MNNYNYGAVLSSHTRQINKDAHKFKTNHTKLPHQHDLRNTQCAPYFKPFEQLNSNSCTSQAVSAAIMCVNRKTKSDVNFNPSTYFNYYYARYIDGTQKTNQGTSLKSSLISASNGISDTKYWPNSESLFSEPEKQAQFDSLNHNVKEYKPLYPSINNLKACLVEGYPFVFSFWITSFMKNWFEHKSLREESNYILQIGNVTNKSNKIAGHACICVGYNDKLYGGVFIIRNSWGSNWGDNGHFYIKYSDIINPFFSNEFYVISDTCNNRCVKNCPKYYNICN